MKVYRESNEVRLSDVAFVSIYCPDSSQRLEQKSRNTLNIVHRARNTFIGTLTRERIKDELRILLKTIFSNARRS
jgi:hypothetical protein